MRTHNQQRQARHNLLVTRAHSMLHAPTPSEEALWQALRGSSLGVAFKRQVVLGWRYIVDFFAPSVGLVVEVDGGVHGCSRSADRSRDAKLRRLGYRVVRVDAALVLRDVAAAVACVQSALPEWLRIGVSPPHAKAPRNHSRNVLTGVSPKCATKRA